VKEVLHIQQGDDIEIVGTRALNNP